MSDLQDDKSPDSISNKVNYQLEQRKILISASLVSVLTLVSLSHRSLFSLRKEVNLTRGIASEESVRFDYAQLEWQKDLAKKLAKVSAVEGERDLAGIGHHPSAFEKLRFGVLEGKYSFQLEHGKVKEMEFVDSQSTNDRPKYINDRIDFLVRWHELFWIDFNRVEMDSQTAQNKLVREKFKLLKGQSLVGYAHVSTDAYGRTHLIRISGKD